MAYEFTGTAVDLGGGRGWLDAPAAASLKRVDKQLGHYLDINEAGRTYAQQMVFWLTYQRNGSPIALHPDTPSIHQVGRAIDTDEQNNAVLNDHGWYRTVYRWVNGVWTLVEPWHYEYFAEKDNHRNETAGGDSSPFDPVTKEEVIPMAQYHYAPERGGLLFLPDGGVYVPGKYDVPYGEEILVLDKFYGGADRTPDKTDITTREWDVLRQAHLNISSEKRAELVKSLVDAGFGTGVPPVVTPPVTPPKA